MNAPEMSNKEEFLTAKAKERSIYVVLAFLLIYIIFSFVLMANTRRQLAALETAHQASMRKLILRQVKVENDLRISNDALALRLGVTEQELQQQMTDKSVDLHWQQWELARQMQSQVVAQQAQIGQVTGDVANIRTELVGAMTDIVANRLDLASTNAKLDHAVGDLNGQSRLIARTREELEDLRHRSDRSYYEFTLSKGATPTPVSTVSLQLKQVDPKRNKFTLNVVADDRTIEKKERGLAEPLQFYTGRDRQLYEVIIFKAETNRVAGYLSTPKSANTTVAGN